MLVKLLAILQGSDFSKVLCDIGSSWRGMGHELGIWQVTNACCAQSTEVRLKAVAIRPHESTTISLFHLRFSLDELDARSPPPSSCGFSQVDESARILQIDVNDNMLELVFIGLDLSGFTRRERLTYPPDGHWKRNFC